MIGGFGGGWRSFPGVLDLLALHGNGFNVKAAGAKGDGVTDDTDALQRAIDVAYRRGYSGIDLPKGIYLTTRDLKLPEIERPNTAGTQGKGFTIRGVGMYDSGIVYTGTDYAIKSEHGMAEAILFKDFYVNHRNGGGVFLPQGAHQLFERFFSSACAEGFYGVYIKGLKGDPTEERPDPNTAGYGSYVVRLEECRFWSETGYRGTGVRIEDSVLCTSIDHCFFSRSITNRHHLELVNCDTVAIHNTAFERSEQPIAPADPATGRTEEMVRSESLAANALMTASLIRLEQCRAVSILDCHAEMVFESFVGIYGNTSGVLIDGAKISHYAITDYNPNKGYTVVVDPASTFSRDIVLGRRNTRVQAAHENSTLGPDYLDPVGCVTVQNFHDHTPYKDANYLRERRSVPRIGASGGNILRNPSLKAYRKTDVPQYIEMVEGDWAFTQFDYKSGCNVKQNLNDGAKHRFRIRTTESIDKHEFYTFIIVGRNKLGVSKQVWVDFGGDVNDFGVILPSGSQQFTQTHIVTAKPTDVVDIVVYGTIDLDIFGMYVIPGIVSEVPYGSEALAVSEITAVNLRGRAVMLDGLPQLPSAGWDHRGKVVIHDGGDGVGDKLYVCLRGADGTFSWVELGV